MTARVSDLSGVLQQVRAEWRANQRLQVISLACFIIFLVFCHVQLDRARVSLRDTGLLLEAEYVDKKAVASDDSWPEKEKSASAMLEETDLMFWSAGSEGEAIAKVRDHVQFMAMASGVELERVNVDILPLENSAYQRVHVDLRGDYEVGAWHEFINNLMVTRPIVLVESEQLDLRRSRERFRLGLFAWVKLGEGRG